MNNQIPGNKLLPNCYKSLPQSSRLLVPMPPRGNAYGCGAQVRNSLFRNWATNAIGVAEYQLTQSLPQAFKSSLPSIEEIEAELAGELGDQYE